MAVYLRTDTSAEETQRAKEALKALPGAASVRYFSNKDALNRLRENLRADRDLLAGVEAKWLPASFQVTLRGSSDTLAEAQTRLLSLGRALRAVEEVRTLRRWQRRLDAVSSVVSYVSNLLAGLTLLVCGYVVAVTVRLGMLARREEIRLQRLLGATTSFVAAPLLVEGCLKALVGGLAAVGLLYGLHELLMPRIMELTGPGPAESALRFLSPTHMVVAVGLTTVAGLLGSGLAVGRARA